MIASIFKGLGRVILLLATMVGITVVSLFVVGAYLTTWPLLRLSPRDKRIRVGVDLMSSVFAALSVFGPSLEGLTDESDQG